LFEAIQTKKGIQGVFRIIILETSCVVFMQSDLTLLEENFRIINNDTNLQRGNKMNNLNCMCVNRKCPMLGNCKACRAYHKMAKPYCESGKARRAFMRFTSSIYSIMVMMKPKK
jgi:hypothetical protein